jgi:uroporphyrinogen-III synthase
VIPLVIPPLSGLRVLVTRPAVPAAKLAASIEALRGEAIVFPSIAVEPLEPAPPEEHALVIFVSAHAVEFGAKLVRKSVGTRIAAIGKATAAALAAVDLPPDIVPEHESTSESLLAHPALKVADGKGVLIVKGTGGRETLREAFAARGIAVTTCEVYRRIKPTIAADQVAALESRWTEHGIDVVTATSVETYMNLLELLTPRGRELLNRSTLLAPTQRIIDAARGAGWKGDELISGGADDLSIVRTLSRWHARARIT